MPFRKKDKPCIRFLQEFECVCQSNKTFKDSESLIKHLKKSKVHKRDRSLKNYCSPCDATFVSKRGFIDHLRNKAIHRYDLHQVACNGRYQELERFMRSQYANETGSSHQITGKKRPRQIGYTPMHCAAFGGHERCLQIMLNWQDGDPNVRDNHDGRTPVHVAAWTGNYACLRLLLKHGGDPYLEDKNGETAMDLSTRECKLLIFRLYSFLSFQKRLMSKSFGKAVMNVNEHLSSRSSVGNSRLVPLHSSDPLTYHDAHDCSARDNWRSRAIQLSRFSELVARYRLPLTDSDDFQTAIKGRFQDLTFASSKETNQASGDKRDNQAAVDMSEEACMESNEAVVEDKEDSVTLPYEVLARGPSSVAAFNNALKHGKASVPCIQLTVIGDVGAGKTNLVRILSGENFKEEREETHGIVTSMVEKTNLDSAWKVQDQNISHVDEILAEKVADNLRVREPVTTSEGRSTADVTLRDQFPRSDADEQQYEAVDGMCSSHSSYKVEKTEDFKRKRANSSDQSPEREQVESSSPLQRDVPYDKILENLHGSLPDDKKVYSKISIWDFAGHPLYQTMHHIFLNRRSFYILVFSLLKFVQEPDAVLSSLRFWLNSVQVHAPKTTPIFLVGTHCKHPDVSKKDIEQANKYLNESVVDAFSMHLVQSSDNSYLFAVENSAGSLDERAIKLKEAIEQEASKTADEEFPIRWLHFEETIIKQRQALFGDPCCVTKAEVLEIVKAKCGKVDDCEFESMLKFYHDSGVIVLPELIHSSAQNPYLKNKVVLEPQRLVNVMTRIHDISSVDKERQFKTHWRVLEEKGMADKELLEYAWKDFSDPIEDLVVLLEGVGMLCPLQIKCSDLSSPPSSPAHDDESATACHVTKYVIPFHLKKKLLNRRWAKFCRQWKGICSTDKVLIFDFQAFLPPALFSFLLVKMIAESKRTSGMDPVISRHSGIFSLGDSFYFMLIEVQKFNQIHVFARHQHNMNLCELYETLYNVMEEICKEYFRFMKYTSGPPCPNPSCPGASADGRVLESDSSEESCFEDEEDEADTSMHCRKEVCRELSDKRQHVVQINPQSPSTPLWCKHTPLQDFEEIREWCEPQQVQGRFYEEKSEIKNLPVEQCCMVILSEKLGTKWKNLGRMLGVSDSTIDNIEHENPGDQEERAYKVMQKWKERFPSEIVNTGTLIDTLNELQCQEIVNVFLKHCSKKH